MAAPAVLAILLGVVRAVLPPADKPSAAAGRWWVPAYSFLGAVGFLFGAWSFHAIS
jgi:hypothetical protein